MTLRCKCTFAKPIIRIPYLDHMPFHIRCSRRQTDWPVASYSGICTMDIYSPSLQRLHANIILLFPPMCLLLVILSPLKTVKHILHHSFQNVYKSLESSFRGEFSAKWSYFPSILSEAVAGITMCWQYHPLLLIYSDVDTPFLTVVCCFAILQPFAMMLVLE